MKDQGSDATRARILDLVEALIMERGFNAISYQDVSDRIGIRKASVHDHFPTEADLGVAVIRQYSAKLAAAIAPIRPVIAAEFAPALAAFLDIFAAVADSPRRVCPGGVLGAAFETLREPMRVEVRNFYQTAQGWLSALLQTGRDLGGFQFSGSPDGVARLILSAMEGALIIGRALQDPAQLREATSRVLALTGAAKAN